MHYYYYYMHAAARLVGVPVQCVHFVCSVSRKWEGEWEGEWLG